jgi:hypothetical protein
MEYKRVFNPDKGKWESIRVYTEEEVRQAIQEALKGIDEEKCIENLKKGAN